MSRKSHDHNIKGMKGRDLEKYMIETVDKNWNHGDEHRFYNQEAGTSSTKPDFKIEVNNRNKGKTINQTGNAAVEFAGERPQKWNDYKGVVQNPTFPKERKRYLANDVSKADFTDPVKQANLLTSFEIARRKPGENFPIKRNDVKQAVSGVMKTNDDEAYSDKVSTMLKMFGSDVSGRTKEQKYGKRVEALNDLKIAKPRNKDRGVDEVTGSMFRLGM